MKKRLISIALTAVLGVSLLAGCGVRNDNAGGTTAEENVETTDEDTADTADTEEASVEEPVGLANPWRDCTEEEANAACFRLFKAPEGASNIKWSIMEEGADPSGFPGPLVQLTFDIVDTYSTLSFTARAKQTSDENEDISGMYYEWDVTDDATLANWGGGNMQGKCYRALTDTETADLITWFDVEVGISYSLSTVAEDLDGFDIQAIAEAMYNEEADTSGQYEDFLQFQAGKTEFTDYDEIISYLTPGQGYAYIDVIGSDEKVLAVTELVFEADHSANEAALYGMKDGKPKALGYVMGNGSAYPLRCADGVIYGGDNHEYDTYFLNPDGDGVMMKDYVSDGINGDNYPEYDGFMRKTNTFDDDENFTGGEDEFNKLLADREKKPVIEFTPVE